MAGDSLVTAGILAAVALSEGIRLVPPGSLVLERPRGRWRVAQPFELGSGLRFVSWCIPYTLPAVLLPAPLADTHDAEGIRQRVAAIEPHVTTSRIFGAVILVVLVAGVPYSASHWSGIGLLAALALLLALCVTQAVVTRRALERLDESRGAGWRMLWPFSAPRAPQLIQERALAGFSPLLVAHTLLADDDLLRAMRPVVYDLVSDREASAPELLKLYERAELERFISRPVDTDGYPYCPRCSSVYRSGTASCADCDDVALIAAS